MAAEFKTRGGLRPDQNQAPFTVNTQQVEKYLQDKIDAVLPNKGVRISVRNINASKRFYPFVVALTLNALYEREGKDESDIPSIFNPKDEDKTVVLRPELFELFKGYMYNKKDGEAFESSMWRHEMGVSTRCAQLLNKFRTAKKMEFDGGQTQRIMFIIDPLRVFYDMSSSTDGNNEKYIRIDRVQKINNGIYSFKFYRKDRRDKNNGKSGNYFAQFSRMFNNGGN